MDNDKNWHIGNVCKNTTRAQVRAWVIEHYEEEVDEVFWFNDQWNVTFEK